MTEYFKIVSTKLGKEHLLPSVVICLGTDLAECSSKPAAPWFSRKMIKCCLFWGSLLALVFALPVPGKEGPCGHS